MTKRWLEMRFSTHTFLCGMALTALVTVGLSLFVESWVLLGAVYGVGTWATLNEARLN